MKRSRWILAISVLLLTLWYFAEPLQNFLLPMVNDPRPGFVD